MIQFIHQPISTGPVSEPTISAHQQPSSIIDDISALKEGNSAIPHDSVTVTNSPPTAGPMELMDNVWAAADARYGSTGGTMPAPRRRRAPTGSGAPKRTAAVRRKPGFSKIL